MCKVTDTIEAVTTCDCQREMHWADRPITKPFAWFGAVVFLACIGLAIYGWVSGGMGGAAPPHRTDSTTAEPAE